jgi:NAD(P)-dependent dehydrogenase (short-subunit alcohol dehydrogenase family)
VTRKSGRYPATPDHRDGASQHRRPKRWRRARLSSAREGRRRKEPWIERDDVTNAILYVESDARRFVTGTTISVA